MDISLYHPDFTLSRFFDKEFITSLFDFTLPPPCVLDLPLKICWMPYQYMWNVSKNGAFFRNLKTCEQFHKQTYITFFLSLSPNLNHWLEIQLYRYTWWLRRGRRSLCVIPTLSLSVYMGKLKWEGLVILHLWYFLPKH